MGTEGQLAVKNYYVTEDLEGIVTSWCKSHDLKTPEIDLFTRLRQQLKANLAETFSQPVSDDEQKSSFNVSVEYVHRSRFRTLHREAEDNEFWIALDDVCIPRAEMYLDLCRIYDRDGIKIGVGSRPLGKRVDHQLDDCERAYSTRSRDKTVVVLADDGTYSGNSIVEAARLLRRRGIAVERINLGFCTDEGVATIRKELPRVQLGASLLVDRTRDTFTWICERDFYLGVPRSGRPLGYRLVESAMPCDKPIAFAGLEPFAASRHSSKIKRGFYDFSRKQIASSLELWSAIEDVNCIRFKVGDVPRFPGPGLVPEYDRFKEKAWTEYVCSLAGLMFCDVGLAQPEAK